MENKFELPHSVRDCFLTHKPQHFVYSDASATGCGSVITLNEEHICHRFWGPSECSKSSTWRELAAIDFSLESFAPVLEDSLVKSGLLIVSRLRKSSKLEA